MDMPAPILIPENAEQVWLGFGASVNIAPAAAAIAAGEPVIFNLAGASGSVIPFDGGSSTDVAFLGVALNAAASGEEVTVITRGVATVTKDTGTAWAVGDVIGCCQDRERVRPGPRRRERGEADPRVQLVHGPQR